MIQNYDPFRQPILSAAVAALPVLLLLVMIASGKVKAYWAALIALAATLIVAIWAYGMPVGMAAKGTVLGLVGGFFPIGWIIVLLMPAAENEDTVSAAYLARRDRMKAAPGSSRRAANDAWEKAVNGDE